MLKDCLSQNFQQLFSISHTMNENIHSINAQKIKNMLKLEELFYNKYLTVQLLHQLISLYTCSIESLDQAQSELRLYFLSKIQFVLSRTESQALLRAKTTNALYNVLRETLKATCKMDLPSPTVEQNRKILYNYNGEHENEKRKKIDLQLKVMEQTKKNMDELKEKADEERALKLHECDMIREITRSQNQILEARLAERREKKRKRTLKESSIQNQKKQQSDLLIAEEELRDALVKMAISMNACNNQEINTRHKSPSPKTISQRGTAEKSNEKEYRDCTLP